MSTGTQKKSQGRQTHTSHSHSEYTETSMAKSKLKSSSAEGTELDDEDEEEEYDDEEEVEEDYEESEEEGETTVVDDDMSGKSLLGKTLIDTLPTQIFSHINKVAESLVSEIKTKEKEEEEQFFMEAIRRKLAEQIAIEDRYQKQMAVVRTG